MGSADEEQQDYDNIATQYDLIESLPHSRITQELVLAALGDCTGQVILDLGGGSGLHARNAIAHGAARVDNVDLSPAMLANCAKLEESQGRNPATRITCHVGDVTKPLARQTSLPGRDGTGLYDAVLMIWTFDHATTLADLGQMWRNAAKYCAPGGKLITIRTNPLQPSPAKYGVYLHEITPVGEGDEKALRYSFTVGFEKPFTAVATNLEANYDLERARLLAKEYGFHGLYLVGAEECECVQAEGEFWREYVESQGWVCAVGVKDEKGLGWVSSAFE